MRSTTVYSLLLAAVATTEALVIDLYPQANFAGIPTNIKTVDICVDIPKDDDAYNNTVSFMTGPVIECELFKATNCSKSVGRFTGRWPKFSTTKLQSILCVQNAKKEE